MLTSDSLCGRISTIKALSLNCLVQLKITSSKGTGTSGDIILELSAVGLRVPDEKHGTSADAPAAYQHWPLATANMPISFIFSPEYWHLTELGGKGKQRKP